MEKHYCVSSTKEAFALIEQEVGKIRFYSHINLARLIDNDEMAGSQFRLGEIEVIDEDGDENYVYLYFIPLSPHCKDEDFRCPYGKPHIDLCGIFEVKGLIWIDVCEHHAN